MTEFVNQTLEKLIKESASEGPILAVADAIDHMQRVFIEAREKPLAEREVCDRALWSMISDVQEMIRWLPPEARIGFASALIAGLALRCAKNESTLIDQSERIAEMKADSERMREYDRLVQIKIGDRVHVSEYGITGKCVALSEKTIFLEIENYAPSGELEMVIDNPINGIAYAASTIGFGKDLFTFKKV